MVKNIYFVTMLIMLMFKGVYAQNSQVIHYWHFNNLENNVLFETIAADISENPGAAITYPGFGEGYMDRVSDPTDINIIEGYESSRALRVRNPSDARELVFSLPTFGYENINFSYAVKRTNNGQTVQAIYYSENGLDWELFQDNIEVNLDYELKSFDFSNIEVADNNTNFYVKIVFTESNTGDDGNNRFDNVVLRGSQIEEIEATDIYLDVAYDNSGAISVNSAIATDYPYSFVYETGNEILLEALANPGYEFEKWIINGDEFYTNLVSPLVDEAINAVAYFKKIIAIERDNLVYFWNFNSIDEFADSLGVVDTIKADLYIHDQAYITYQGDGFGYMDYTDGSPLNSRDGSAEGYSLRVRNPSDEKSLIINVPTTGFENIHLSYAVRRTTNGQTFKALYYSVSEDSFEWILFEDSIRINTDYEIKTFDFSGVEEANNNENFIIKIDFIESHTWEDGNNRFDNIALEADIKTQGYRLVTVTANDENSGNVNINNIFISTFPYTMPAKDGDILSLTAQQNAGYVFEGWRVGTDLFSDREISIEVEDDVEIEAIFTEIFVDTKETILYYWHFNNLSDESFEFVGSDNHISNAGYLIHYGDGNGYMDRTEGTPLNSRNNSEAEFALRVRNPSENQSIVFNIPTSGFSDINFSYAVRRTNNGQTQQAIYYSISSGNPDWILLNDNLEIFTEYEIKTFDFSDVDEVSDNSDFKIMIEFTENNIGEDGNNRFDNVVVEGNVLTGLNNEKRVLKVENIVVYPNPFLNKVNFLIDLDEASDVKIEIFDLFGKKVDTIENSYFKSGEHLFVWDVSDEKTSKGMFVYRITVNRKVHTGHIYRLVK